MSTTPTTVWVDGTALTVRPIAITDATRLERLFTRLSQRSVQLRFFSPVTRPPRAALLRLADVDHARRDALVALDGDEIVGVARYDARPGATEAEIAVTIEIDKTVRTGMVTLPHGYGMRYQNGAPNGPELNRLTSSTHCDALAKTPFHKYVPVTVEKA